MNNGFSIIIPVYNEEEKLISNTQKLMKFLSRLSGPFEIILSDNGSTDKTFKLAKGLEDKCSGIVKAIAAPERGAGLAFKNAVLVAKYENLITQDMDLTTNLNFIPRTLKLLENSYSIVIGSKRVGRQMRKWHRVFISSIYIFLVELLLGLSYSDYSIGAKGYKRSVVLDYIKKIDKGTFYVIELIYHAKQKNKKIIEIPVYCDDRRQSKFNLFHEVVHRGSKLLSFWFREKITNAIVRSPT